MHDSDVFAFSRFVRKALLVTLAALVLVVVAGHVLGAEWPEGFYVAVAALVVVAAGFALTLPSGPVGDQARQQSRPRAE